jgi:hypothetical protein
MQQVHRYALASFLLGTDGTQYFYFSPNGNDDGVDAPDTPDDHVNPGTPVTGYTALANGAYVRRFTAGYVAVNPSAATVNVNLGGTYVDLDGTSVQQATLAPHSGMVFTASTSGGTTTTSTSTTTTTVRVTTTTTTRACVPRRTTTTTAPLRTASLQARRRAGTPGSPGTAGTPGQPGPAAGAKRCRPPRAP